MVFWGQTEPPGHKPGDEVLPAASQTLPHEPPRAGLGLAKGFSGTCCLLGRLAHPGGEAQGWLRLPEGEPCYFGT